LGLDLSYRLKKPCCQKKKIIRAAHELKIIVFNKHDFIWAEEQAAKVGKDCFLYLQPEWSKRNEITPLIVEYVKQNPRWMISLQTHKYIDIP
jgi:7-carboxy-7-deazaguanine synthase